ncbi:GntR family transcriptional regulator [Dictyobacter kobayashii]|uniref:GntR family transcriptional regulator n=1 Tax=Dictyobacter kobayashii TaxID=2014872 RepID=UPI0013867B9E|nr:GntR family transcriptional regulator [Dictyobacter kobayashii]
MSIKSFDENDLQIPKQRRSEQFRRVNAKVADVSERLRVLASDLGPGSRLPTIRELCSLLNTSSATLTTALDLLENEQIFYRKARHGIFVSDILLKRSIHIVFNISLIASNAASPFWSLLWGKLAQIVEQRAKVENEYTSFHFLSRPLGPHQLPDELITLLNAPTVDGCLIIGFNSHSDDHVPLLPKPHVVFAGGGDWMVKHDVIMSARLAADVMVRKNCQRIGYWSAAAEDIDSEFDQAHFFNQALQQQHLPVDHSLFRYIPQVSIPMHRTLSLQERGYLLAKEVFGSPQGERPDGIYITDDLVADGHWWRLKNWEYTLVKMFSLFLSRMPIRRSSSGVPGI